MGKLYVKDWEVWQSYRKDRGAPPWIKVHRSLMTNAKWASLSDAEKGQLVSIWIVAADNGGSIPSDPQTIRKICQLDEAPNVEKLVSLGLLAYGSQDDANLTPTWRQHDAPETETETETETEEEKKEEELPDFQLSEQTAEALTADAVPSKYFFEGEIIKLTKEHWEQWRKRFPYLGYDYRGLIEERDRWLQQYPERKKGWFFSTERYLSGENDKRKGKAAQWKQD